MIDRDKRHPEKVNKPFNPIKRKPEWIRSKLTNTQEFFLTKSMSSINMKSTKLSLWVFLI